MDLTDLWWPGRVKFYAIGLDALLEESKNTAMGRDGPSWRLLCGRYGQGTGFANAGEVHKCFSPKWMVHKCS